MTMARRDYRDQVNSQIAQFANVKDIHARPEVANYLYDTFTKPRLYTVFGSFEIIEIYARHLSDAAVRTGVNRVISLGAGYGSLEISIMSWIRDHGLPDFELICTDLSPILTQRTNKSIADAGLAHCMSAQVADLNQPFGIDGPIAGIMVHHALHHFVELEHIFSVIDYLLHPEGVFITEDMIGRNGHMRWPEALEVVKEIWAGLPERYRFNHIQQKHSSYYQNWDCSVEGFEGIRAQDILPQLLSRFRFEKFFANLSLVDVFASTAFGPNFSIDNSQDLEFITSLQNLEDALIDGGVLKPVQMFAIMRTLRSATCRDQPMVFKARTPQRCVRSVDPIITAYVPALAEMGFENPYADESSLAPLVPVALGEDLPFGAGQLGVPLLRSNWDAPEEHFTWAWGVASDLEFQAADTIQTISFHIIPVFIPGIANQTLSVAVNGKHVGEIVIKEDGGKQAVLPLTEPINRRTRVQIEFTRDRPRRPDLDPGIDTRPLSFALISMHLT